MSASVLSRAAAVTPAKVRRRAREEQARGPLARPQRLGAPGARPVQPGLAGLSGQPLALVGAPQRRTGTAPAGARPAPGVRLTDRGLMVVIGLLAVITVATLALGAVKFFGVSNAPLDENPGAGVGNTQAQDVSATAPLQR